MLQNTSVMCLASSATLKPVAQPGVIPGISCCKDRQSIEIVFGSMDYSGIIICKSKLKLRVHVCLCAAIEAAAEDTNSECPPPGTGRLLNVMNAVLSIDSIRLCPLIRAASAIARVSWNDALG